MTPFIILDDNSENFSNFIEEEKLDKVLKIIINAINGKTMVNIIFIIPLDKNATAGLYTVAETFPPEATIKVNIMGDIISVSFAIFSITILTFFQMEIICPDSIKTTLNNPTKSISSPTLFEIIELFSFCKIPHISAIINISMNHITIWVQQYQTH